MIKFSARGEQFSIPNKLLEKYPESMLYILSNNSDFPIDRLDECIYVDVNPFTIDSIMDYYNLGKVQPSNIYIAMDMKYLGLDIEHAFNISPCMNRPVIYNETVHDVESSVHSSRFYRIYTTNNKIITMDTSLYNAKNLNILGSMIYADEKNDMSSSIKNVYVSVNDTIMNIILTILRDGLNWYYEYLADNKKYFYKLLENYTSLLDKTKFDMSKYCDEPCHYECLFHDYSSCDRGIIESCENCQKNRKKSIYKNIKNIICNTDDDTDDDIETSNNDYAFSTLQFDLNRDIEKSIQAINTIINNVYTNTEKWLNDSSNGAMCTTNMNNKILDYLRLYNICDKYSEDQLKNRLDRAALLNIRDNINYYCNDDIPFFSEEDINNNGYISLNHSNKKFFLFDNLLKHCDRFKMFAKTLNIDTGYYTIICNSYVIKDINNDANIELTKLMSMYLYGL